MLIAKRKYTVQMYMYCYMKANYIHQTIIFSTLIHCLVLSTGIIVTATVLLWRYTGTDITGFGHIHKTFPIITSTTSIVPFIFITCYNLSNFITRRLYVQTITLFTCIKHYRLISFWWTIYFIYSWTSDLFLSWQYTNLYKIYRTLLHAEVIKPLKPNNSTYYYLIIVCFITA